MSKAFAEQERIHKVCHLGKYQTLPFICVATGAQPSVVVKEVLRCNWLGMCTFIETPVVVPDRVHRENSCDAISDYLCEYLEIDPGYLGFLEEDEKIHIWDLIVYHLEWFLIQHTADLLLDGAESKNYKGWGKLQEWEENEIRAKLGPGYPKRVTGLSSELKIQYGGR